MREQFYPKWYVNKKKGEQGNYFRKVLILSIVLSLISIINIFNSMKELEAYERGESRMNSIIIDESRLKDLTVIEGSEFKTLDKFNFIYEKLHGNKEVIKTLRVINEVIYLEIFAADMKEYGEMVRVLEENFIIEEISALLKDADVTYFNVRMRTYEV